ncbi:Piwi-domain-containing protein [Patellaria atrata CBS 101060]|uniref:Piwi-domain-containing protein n=1 Tax=Patellaria atrata CBS 101060 TaxID=1346257 RepID=A0A9P4SBA4_9PEZI|nr:Piwi-domain-containing protein [Patellaria atrata CBS 101060]
MGRKSLPPGTPTQVPPNVSSQTPSDDQHSFQSVAQYDGGRDPASAAITVDNRRLELGALGSSFARGFDFGDRLPRRQALNTKGREILVKLNTFTVNRFATKPVHQYDVLIGNGNEKRQLIKKIWNSRTLQAELGDHGWIFDGNKIAWASEKRPDINIKLDMDKEQGRPSHGKNIHKISIKHVNVVKFDVLTSFLEGKTAFDNAILEAINFLDHLMREGPAANLTQIKKSFFSRGQARTFLGGGVEAFKGVFSSMRLARGVNGAVMSVNVDVSNCVFITSQKLIRSVAEVCNVKIDQLGTTFRKAIHDGWDRSRMYRDLKRFKKFGVVVEHRGTDKVEYVIDKFLPQTCAEYKFKERLRNDKGEVVSEKLTTLKDYFMTKYNIAVDITLPVVKMTRKDSVIPMDVLTLLPNQRWVTKLDDKQTANMIKVAVTLPAQRWADIDAGLKLLDWPNDRHLKHYGMHIEPQATVVKARVLPPPDVMFANGKEPGAKASSGRWRIDGKKFIQPNTTPIKVWGVCVVQGRGAADPNSCTRFFQEFVNTYDKQHGGRFAERVPTILPGQVSQGIEMVTTIWNTVGNKHKARPQILFFVLPDKNTDVYNMIKRACDCRYGVVSQCLQSAHVQKCQGQYISNVCLKVNVKLGGINTRAVGQFLPRLPSAKISTVIVGADVSHASPGSEQASMAAITMSLNPDFTRYAAQVETNGQRVEMVTTENINKLFGKLLNFWVKSTTGKGALPQRIIYVRDGVSEGQYAHVLDQEVKDMKAFCLVLNNKVSPKFTVVVASKRHHVRFFPTTGADRNGNPVPGTLVETGVTHPFEWDFYLNAHSAIKGTARPVHYHVLLNEAGISNEELQQLLYEHSYQYARATTPVSMFPAVYYAHLASKRAISHTETVLLSSGKKEAEQIKSEMKSSTKGTDKDLLPEITPLKPMPNDGQINVAMWYI